MKDDKQKMEDLPCLWIRRINFIKMYILAKAIYKFNEILIKISTTLFESLQNNNSYGNIRDFKQLKQSFKNSYSTGSITKPDFRTYYGAVIIKTVCSWHKDKTCNYGTLQKFQKSIHTFTIN